MSTQCTFSPMKNQGVKTREVIAKFDGENITSDGGGLLIREIEKGRGFLKSFSKCFTDYRNPKKIEHSVFELICQRVYGIILGNEDLNDHDELRADPLLAMLCGKKDILGEERKRELDKGKPLAGKSTLNRLELTKLEIKPSERYKKITHNEDSIKNFFIDSFIQSHNKKPDKITLDLDATDDLIHGNQEGRFYHGYYRNYCYLPFYIFSGDFLLCAKLNTSDKDSGKNCVSEVQHVVSRIRESWPDVSILLRGDSGFCREVLMHWCESNHVDYLFGLAKNSILIKKITEELEQAKELYEKTQQSARVFKDFIYRTQKSWSCARRVVGKAEHLAKGSNPRFVVTSLSQKDIPAKELYERKYCPRGDMENRIKEQQLYLFSDRTSTSKLRSNQLRLWFSGVAYVILNELRRIALKGTDLAKAQCHTMRNKLLKIGAQVKIRIRRIYISLSSSCPYQTIFKKAIQSIKSAYCS